MAGKAGAQSRRGLAGSCARTTSSIAAISSAGLSAQRRIDFLEQPRRRMQEALQRFPVTTGGVAGVELAGRSVVRQHHRIRMSLR